MKRPVLVLLSTLTLAAASATLVGPAGAADGGRPLSADLTGAAERPGPGDPDGSGSATIRVNPGLGRICYTLTVEGIEPATAAHIHVAPPSDPGPVVVALVAPTDGSSEACAEGVDRALARAIIQDPGAYYVNVHNTTYPAGALRGQLSK